MREPFSSDAAFGMIFGDFLVNMNATGLEAQQCDLSSNVTTLITG